MSETDHPERDERMPQPPGTEKRRWNEPKLTFVEPMLTEEGEFTQLTAQNGFFGTFVP
jgi:hypothetical protein